MKVALRILLIEDVEDHALLIVRELSKAGLTTDFARVESLPQLEAALAEKEWDAIISDFNLPGFNALEALKYVNGRDIDIPFILVSGVIGEELAAEVIKAGAHGYVAKGNYARLAPMLERELREAAIRHERRLSAVELTRRRDDLEKLLKEKSVELEQTLNALETEMRLRRQAEEELEVLKARLGHLN